MMPACNICLSFFVKECMYSLAMQYCFSIGIFFFAVHVDGRMETSLLPNPPKDCFCISSLLSFAFAHVPARVILNNCSPARRGGHPLWFTDGAAALAAAQDQHRGAHHCGAGDVLPVDCRALQGGPVEGQGGHSGHHRINASQGVRCTSESFIFYIALSMCSDDCQGFAFRNVWIG